MEAVAEAVLRLLVQGGVAYGCEAGRMEEILRDLRTPEGQNRIWEAMLSQRMLLSAANPAMLPLLYGPGQRASRSAFDRFAAWARTPTGQAHVRSALMRLCEFGEATAGVGKYDRKKARAVEKGNPQTARMISGRSASPRGLRRVTVAGGLATRLAESLERCACQHTAAMATPAVEPCCDARSAARALRDFDADQVRRIRAESLGGWAPLTRRGGITERVPFTVETMAAPRGARGLTVNVAAMWKLATKSLYSSDDLISLATREALQNAVDSVRKAIRTGKTERGTGAFHVSWEAMGDGTGVLEFKDNGVGMSESILVNKFLELGSSGKEDDPEAGGGFGMAKAVVLGVSPTFHWEIRTGNRIARSLKGSTTYQLWGYEGGSWQLSVDGSWEPAEDPPYGSPESGVRVTLYDIPDKEVWSEIFRAWVSPVDAIERVLAWSHTPEVTLYLNGRTIESVFPARRGSRLTYDVRWGSGVDVEIKGYKRDDTKGSIYVRTRGLFQFLTAGVPGLSSDIVLEVTTKIRPGEDGYPFPPSRDTLRGQTAWGLHDLRTTLTRESKSGDEDREYDDFLPDSSDPRERAGAEAFDQGLAAAMEDPAVQALLRELMGETQEILNAEFKEQQEGVRTPVESTAPTGAHVPDDPYAQWRAAGAVIPTEEEVDTSLGRKSLVTVIRAVIGTQQADGLDRILNRIESGDPISAEDATRVVAATGERPSGPSEAGEPILGGVGAVAVAIQVGNLIGRVLETSGGSAEAVRAVRKKASQVNPFGDAAMVKVSRKNFDPDRAKKFMKGAKKFMPHLIAWESVLRLIHREGKITIPYKPGFVLDDTVNAIAYASGESGSDRKNFVLMNPFKFQAYLDANKDPLKFYAVANWVFTVACHELSHLPHMGKGHGEAFVVEREALQLQTGHLVPAILRLLAKVFKVKLPRSGFPGAGTAGPAADRQALLKKITVLEGSLNLARRGWEEAQAAAAQATPAARRLTQIASREGWDPYRVVRILTELGRAEALAEWALSPAGVARLGGRTEAQAIADVLRQRPGTVLDVLQALGQGT